MRFGGSRPTHEWRSRIVIRPARLGEQAAACLEQAQKAQGLDEKAT
jgi:hypothetical protein